MEHKNIQVLINISDKVHLYQKEEENLHSLPLKKLYAQ